MPGINNGDAAYGPPLMPPSGTSRASRCYNPHSHSRKETLCPVPLPHAGYFFGLNLGQYSLYQSEFLNCSPIRALNCYFSMPFRRSARVTVTNEGKAPVNSFYSNIDYQIAPSLPDDVMYFHAQYRQMTPNPIEPGATKINPDGKRNYVYVETRGRGHLMGVTLGVLQNSENWMGEGDDMIFVDDESKPV